MYKKTKEIKSVKQKVVRSNLATMLVIARLSWGEVLSPLNWYYNFSKLFPPARKSVYKQGVANYFFRN